MIKKIFDMCDNVYGDKEKQNDVLESITKGNDYLEIILEDNTLHFIFRGSDDAKDWKENIMEDFSETFTQFEDDVLRVTKMCLDKQIICAGHSRGGALATYCALVVSLIKPCSCITFGSPRVSSRSFRDKYNQCPIDHTNFRNGWDQVTYLPLYSFGFRHVGKIVQLKKSQWWRLGYFRIKAHTRKEYRKSLDKRYK